MSKQDADKHIFEYLDKIFGFSLDKMKNIEQAQELASDIVYQVYLSFLKKDDIVNLDGYVYRIARNVYARYIHQLETGKKFESIEGMAIPFHDTYDSIDDNDVIERLKREIGYLSKRQRLVIYMHYYDKLSVKEIALTLGISQGTVMWHLSDARTKLKAGIDMNVNEQNLVINPIKFVNMGTCGSPSPMGGTETMFDNRLKENIAWACYHEPKTLEEISRIIGVSSFYVADNLEKLVDYAYIDKLDNSKNPKYRTNMLISDLRIDLDYGDWFEKATELLIEKYILQTFTAFESDPKHWGFSCDGDDINFLKYNLVMACLAKFWLADNGDNFAKFQVQRPDGGNFIAMASVNDDRSPKINLEDFPYWSCGIMTRDAHCYTSEDFRENIDKAFEAISMDCRFADRNEGWQDNRNEDWEALLKFMNEGKEKLSLEEYKRVCDKGYVFEDKVQPAIFRTKVDVNETISNSLKRYLDRKITIPSEITDFAKEMDEAFYTENKRRYPEHILPVAKAVWCTNTIGSPTMLPRIIEKLLEKRLLDPLSDIQRKSVFSIICLPEYE